MSFTAHTSHLLKRAGQSARRAPALICLLLLCSSLFPSRTVAATTVLRVMVVYAIDTHQFSTGGSFLDAIRNPNDPNVRCNFAFPPDALSSGAPVAMTVYSTMKGAVTDDAPLPGGKLGANTFYNFSFTNALTGSALTSFDKPITLTFFYSDADISGMDESTLVPYRWDGSSWSALTGYAINTGINKVTVSTKQFSTFALLGTAPAEEQESSTGGGSGGGGGGIISAPTSVILSGRAYPRSPVTILKDAQIAASTYADNNADFAVNITNLSGGNYMFAVHSEDTQGIRSSLLTFPVSVTSGATTKIAGLLIAPTIAIDKSEVRRKDAIVISGQSMPNGEVTVEVSPDGGPFYKTKADHNGAYLLHVDTSSLAMGQHFVRSKTAYGSEVSSYGKSVGFTVGTKNVAAESPRAIARGDINKDTHVNLVDFSIAAYWYKRPEAPEVIDLNGDGKIDLADFSIMAFYWTG